MLLSISKARNYYEAKNIHRREVQVAEHGVRFHLTCALCKSQTSCFQKRQNPGMTIIYVKETEHVPSLADSELSTPPISSPPPRVILAANDDIAW